VATAWHTTQKYRRRISSFKYLPNALRFEKKMKMKKE